MPTCDREISLQKYQSRQEGNLQCRTCSKIRGYVHGVPVRSARIWGLRSIILEFRTVDKRLQPFIKCAQRGCKEPVLLRHDKYHAKDTKASGRCPSHRVDGRSMSPYTSQYNIFKRQAQKRLVPFSLPFKSFVALYTATSCHYCAANITKGAYRLSKSQALGIDRKDSFLGYSTKNCVPCCSSCNFSKNAFLSYEEMLVLGALRAQDIDRAQQLIRETNWRKNASSIHKPYKRLSVSLKAAWAKKSDMKPS